MYQVLDYIFCFFELYHTVDQKTADLVHLVHVIGVGEAYILIYNSRFRIVTRWSCRTEPRSSGDN